MRRFLQFRLRSLLVVVTMASLVCGWVGAQFRSRRAELQALAALQPSQVLVVDASQPVLPQLPLLL